MTWEIMADGDYITEDDNLVLPQKSELSDEFVEDCKNLSFSDLFFKHVFPDVTGTFLCFGITGF
jgi:hypothetical protein